MFYYLLALNEKSCLNNTLDSVNSFYGTNHASHLSYNSTILESNFTEACTIKFRTASEEFWT